MSKSKTETIIALDDGCELTVTRERTDTSSTLVATISVPLDVDNSHLDLQLGDLAGRLDGVKSSVLSYVTEMTRGRNS